MQRKLLDKQKQGHHLQEDQGEDLLPVHAGVDVF